MANLLPYDLVRGIVQFLPWMEQIEILPELKPILMPKIEKKSDIIKTGMKKCKMRILADINQEYPNAKLMRIAMCLYRESDTHRLCDISKVLKHPNYFSYEAAKAARLGYYLEWPIRKTHRRMITQMTDADIAANGW